MLSLDRLPIPSALAVGAVHTALTDAGLRGRTDIVLDAADVLDVHAMAMAVAVGATAVHPRLALELAAELAGTRGAEALTSAMTVANLIDAFVAGLRKTLARMGISAIASYVGGSLIDTVDLAPDVLARCFPSAAAWPGATTLADLGARLLRRRDAAIAIAEPAPGREARLPDPGFARYRGDGEAHLFAPRIASEMQALSGVAPTLDEPIGIDRALARYRSALARPVDAPVVPRDGLRVRRAATAVPLSEVESARSIARRFVVSAMSVGALSPEAHQALTIGIQRAGGAANTGEGGEDPGVVRAPTRTADVATRVSSRSRRRGSGSPPRTWPGRTSSRSRSPRARSRARVANSPAGKRRPTSRRFAAGRPGRATSARHRTTTSTRSRTSPS